MNARIFMVLVGSALLVNAAQGAGFALIEQNASGLGNAYAGQAAVAADASTIFFNPAGLTYIQGRQAVVAGHLIMPSAKFSDAGSTPVAPGDGGDAGETVFVPNLYYAMGLTPDIKFGVGVNAPFGLTTEYDDTWVGQLQAIKSEMKTVNVNPTLAWRVDDRVSLGFGVNWQYIDAELTQAAGVGPNPPKAKMNGDDSSWGWNAGALFGMQDGGRIGFSYRSEIRHRLEGDLKALGFKNKVHADVDLPASASLSYFQPMNSRWEFLADMTWTGWSSFDKLAVINDSGPLKQPDAIQEKWRDSMRYSLGANYRPSREWIWRFGAAYDETPVPDKEHRTPRIPDADRIWLALGGQYRFNPDSAVDFGYAHLFVNDEDIEHINKSLLKGSYDSRIDILSAQYTHSF
jgi:long-chain fatty acid transport protein